MVSGCFCLAFTSAFVVIQAFQLRRAADTDDCWLPCGNSSGTCDWCSTGLCCRKNFVRDPPECAGTTVSDESAHRCVEKLPALEEIDTRDCWKPCGNRSGHCTWCGVDRFCCRKGFADAPECAGSMATDARRHHCVAPADHGPPLNSIARYAQQLAALPVRSSARRPSIFAFVFSRLDGIDRRSQIRTMWKQAQSNSKVDVVYKFAMCGGTSSTSSKSGPVSSVPDRIVAGDTEVSTFLSSAEHEMLVREAELHQDVVYLDCDEGYSEGALTRKVLASMRYYWSSPRADYFMKVDDDTFVAWSRYAPKLVEKGSPYVYMGIPIGEGAPCRLPGFKWYEPWSTFNKALFPKGMSGGSGYTIGRNLVDMILNARIGEQNVLYNEDRAVGVWMDRIVQSGTRVDYVGIEGIDGFWAWDWQHPTENWFFWRDYPHVVHHGLEGKTIGCLARAEIEQDDTQVIKYCFAPENGKVYQPLSCASMNDEAKQVKASMSRV